MNGRDDPFGDIERIFEQMSSQFGATRGAISIDLLDEGERYVLLADLPGFDPAEVDLQVRDERTVHIEADRDSTAEDWSGRYVTRERRQDRLSRTVTLPDAISASGAEASFDAGVLTVLLPKQTAEEGTDIPVN